MFLERDNSSMRNQFKYLTYALLFVVATLFLTGCQTPIILDPKGSIGVQEKKLIIDAFLLMSIVVIPVIFMTLLFAWKYRASSTHDSYNPGWYHSTMLEVTVWGIPIIIIIVLATMTWRTTHELDPYQPLEISGKPLVIQVVALDWKWLFIYPDEHIATVNFVEFPAHRQIKFLITADAPMNAFHIPQLGTQIYAMAGMQTQLHLVANEAGDYYGRSVNYSGRGFSGMEFVARATDSEATFDKWVQAVHRSPADLTGVEYNQLVKPSENNPVALYGNVTEHLFENIMMKFMMPGMQDLSVDHSKM